ncbi:MAG: SnoaL-like domain-containing protein [Rhodospirillaceae bacterium]|jgi:uncharacterized protein (TIGR02246 family)|nr:SnoaL-like domain-containing protein [Rhodospirillaceae bacterium]MBT5564615.1 SnoaL-like domain-containing protein [Rhodospirillaceae bacterium]MBT6090950.1 SnoaL-like domain-containing protein [Rhodospirillaceae bacterium]MBT6961339.1 SnoaL-like domain-containing protein [Rhodospirillaceae bacterium]
MNRFAVVFVAFLISPAMADDDSVRTFHDSFFAAWNAGDADGLIDRLTEDTIYHPMGAKTLTGREVIGGSYRAFIKSFDVHMAVSPEVLDAHGDHGVMQGTYSSTLTPKDGRPSWSRSGRYHMDLVRGSDGAWRIAREITQATADPTPKLSATEK